MAQIDTESPEESGVEDISEYESVLIGAAMDLVGAMAAVFGGDFVDPLGALLPKITKYYSPARSSTDRGAAMGSLGEIIVGMKQAITPLTGEVSPGRGSTAPAQWLTPFFLNQLLTTLSRALQDEEAAVRSNAAFASGCLIEYTQTDLSEHFPALLNAIRPMFTPAAADEREEISNARDNACGCLSRMILRKQDAVPLEQALPILLSSMPLKRDFAEWTPVLQCFMTLLQANHGAAMTHVDAILQLFAHVLADADEPLDAKTRGQLVGFVSSLNAQAPEKIQAAGLQPYLV
jgi:hypothetical protein